MFSVDMSLGDIETDIDLLKSIASDEKHPLYFSAMQQLNNNSLKDFLCRPEPDLCRPCGPAALCFYIQKPCGLAAPGLSKGNAR